jgi:hypothetical protein
MIKVDAKYLRYATLFVCGILLLGLISTNSWAMLISALFTLLFLYIVNFAFKKIDDEYDAGMKRIDDEYNARMKEVEESENRFKALSALWNEVQGKE